MATLVLQTAGAAIGGLLGGPFGAAIGQAAGALAGNLIDRQIISSIGGRNIQGPRLASMPGVAAAEGTPIPRVYGRARCGGTLIWMTRFEEVANVERAGRSGGKGGGPKVTTYKYFANFAVGICEGPIAGIRRIWADGKELDQSDVSIRIYQGDESQQPDALIVAKEGAGNAPSYRGLAYAVFERMPLDDYGNRLPVLSFEVLRPVEALTKKITAVCLIPGSSEYAYDPDASVQFIRAGVTRSENRHQLYRTSDWTASLDMLQALCPNLQSVALVVSWFGDDLRVGQCTIRPRVEISDKTTSNGPWEVAGLNRYTAPVVSQHDGKPAFGGTPNDAAVTSAIKDLNKRGLKVVFYPFVMMDIPQSNDLVDPWSGAGSQPAYPWRGRITCSPAPGQPDSPDGLAIAGQQVQSFFGSTNPPASEWSFRRFVLHYASLCEAAGGVDTFLIGSELAALTKVRAGPGIYPAAQELASLSQHVASILSPGTNLSYAADWTEYGAHILDDGNEVRFPLDVLWSRPEISFVGIDVYWPMSDWRDEPDHLDKTEAVNIYDLDYLRRQVASGEAFDWYYEDDEARQAQTRTPITDGAYGKPWIYRPKDIKSWWLSNHVERVAGMELPQPTAWVPQSKPIWFTEFGCPAVDKGTNAPNVFPDEKSSENRIPHFSKGNRDDLIQLRALEAVIDRFSPAHSEFEPGNNPVSTDYSGRMVDENRLHIWAWDARPFPAFPGLYDIWADGPAWQTGHWLNGRLEAASLNAIASDIAAQTDVPGGMELQSESSAIIDGYLVDRPMSARSALEPLMATFSTDAIISGGKFRIVDRNSAAARILELDDLVSDEKSDIVALHRAQETDLPQSVTITFSDADNDYRSITAQSRRVEGRSQRELHHDIPAIMNRSLARRAADIFLQDTWIARESVDFAIPPSQLAVEVGDHMQIELAGVSRRFRIVSIDDGASRKVSAIAVETSVFDHISEPGDIFFGSMPVVAGPPQVEVLELATMRGDNSVLQYLAAFADPWPGALAVWRVSSGSTFDLIGRITQPARIGTTTQVFGAGHASRYDFANSLVVQLGFGALASMEKRQALSGNAAIAIEKDGAWEVLTYTRAELVAERTYKLTELVRGIGSAEHLCERAYPVGSRVVVLDEALFPLTSALEDLNIPLTYRVGPARSDISDPAFVEFPATAGAAVLMPYAPVRAKAKRRTEGVQLSFIRRSRRLSDSWEPAVVPVGEDLERYEIEIIQNDAVLRTIVSDSPSAIYKSDEELTDFGSPQAEITVRIFQISQISGRGFSLQAVLPVT